MKLLAAIVALRDAFHNMRWVIWQPFVLSLGVDMKSLGGLESIMDLSRLVVQPIIGSASDIHGRRRWLIVREAILLSIGLLTIVTSSWNLLFFIVILLGLDGALYTIWTALVAESADAKRLGYFFSVIATSSMGAGLIATLGAGYLADAYGFRSVFIISTMFAVSSFILVLTRLPETKAPNENSNFDLRGIKATLIGTLKPSPTNGGGNHPQASITAGLSSSSTCANSSRANAPPSAGRFPANCGAYVGRKPCCPTVSRVVSVSPGRARATPRGSETPNCGPPTVQALHSFSTFSQNGSQRLR